jgi:hypothetical protein
VITGGIIPCQGIVMPGGPRYAAGTVTVFDGRLTWRSIGSGSSVAVFPTSVVARQVVGLNQTYVFALIPGDYVLQATFAPPANVHPFTSAAVTAGTATEVDIPNQCK